MKLNAGNNNTISGYSIEYSITSYPKIEETARRRRRMWCITLYNQSIDLEVLLLAFPACQQFCFAAGYCNFWSSTSRNWNSRELLSDWTIQINCKPMPLQLELRNRCAFVQTRLVPAKLSRQVTDDTHCFETNDTHIVSMFFERILSTQ